MWPQLEVRALAREQLERLVARPRHDAPPVREHCNAMDLRRSQIITKSTVDAATHSFPVPFQRRHASAGRHVPDLERLVLRRRHDAPPVRKHCNARDLRRREIITKVQRTPQRTASECPSSVAMHLPVATSHTLSVPSCDADTTRRPSGETATPLAYNEDTSSQKYHKKRTPRAALGPSVLPASPRICRSRRPTP